MMGIRLSRSLFLCAVIFLQVTPASCGESCVRPLLRSIFGRGKQSSDFDWDRFEKTKAEIRGSSLSSENLPQDFESQMAWAEEKARQNGAQIDLREMIEKSPSLKSPSAFKQNDLQKGVSTIELDSFVDRAYIKAQSWNPLQLAGKGHQGAIRSAIEQRVKASIVRHNLPDALEDLGVIRDPSLKVRFTTVFDRSKKAISRKLGQILRINAPEDRLPPPEIVDAIEKNGIESVYPELYRLYGKSAEFHYYWTWAERATVTYFTVVAGKTVWDMFHPDSKTVEENSKAMDQYLWKDFVLTYRERFGHDPDPNGPAARKMRAFIRETDHK